MTSRHEGTIEGPDLNIPAISSRPVNDYAAIRAWLGRRNEHRRYTGKGEVLTETQMDEQASAATTPRRPEQPRVRVFPDSAGPTWARKRWDGTTVQHYSGLVEFANEPGYSFDYRVRLEVRDNPPRLHTVAAFPIARPHGDPVTVTTATKNLGVIIRRAARALTRVVETDDEGVRKTRGSDEDAQVLDILNRLEGDEPSRPEARRSTSAVDEEARQVAELWHAYQEATAAKPSRGRWIAKEMGWGQSQRELALVRKRLARAAVLGLVPEAHGTRDR